jgi:hypothetical protein
VSQPGVAEWLKKNEKPLELVAAAVLRKHYFNPIVAEATTPGVPQILNGRIPTAQMCREIGALLLCRAMARIADNDFTGAWQDTQTCQRLGRLVAKGGTLIENLVGNSVVLKTCAAQITLLSHCKPTAYQIRLWEKDLEALPAMPGLAQKCDLGERYMSLEVLVRVATHGVGILDKSSGPVPGTVATDDEFWSRLFTRSIDWDPAFINANGFFDRLAAACRLSDRTLRRDALADLIDEVRAIKIAAQDMNAVTANMVSKRRRGELIGNLIRIAVMPAYEKLQNADDRTEQTLRNLKVAFALARFHVETGAYPGGLDGLTPKYMEVVPADLFGGSPLWYAKSEDGYLLYSVGENEFDDGGRSRDDQPRGDDLTVRIPAKPPE